MLGPTCGEDRREPVRWPQEGPLRTTPQEASADTIQHQVPRGLSEPEARRRLAERPPFKPPSTSRSYASIGRQRLHGLQRDPRAASVARNETVRALARANPATPEAPVVEVLALEGTARRRGKLVTLLCAVLALLFALALALPATRHFFELAVPSLPILLTALLGSAIAVCGLLAIGFSPQTATTGGGPANPD